MIVKIRNKSHFVQINNHVLRDKRLSLESRGALAEILTYSEDFDTSVNSLMTLWGIGRKKLLKITNELKQFGYLEIMSVRDRKGKIIDKDWIFYGESQAVDFRIPNRGGSSSPAQDAQNRHSGEPPVQDTLLSNVRQNRSATNGHLGHIYKDLKRNSSQEEKKEFKEELKTRTLPEADCGAQKDSFQKIHSEPEEPPEIKTFRRELIEFQNRSQPLRSNRATIANYQAIRKLFELSKHDAKICCRIHEFMQAEDWRGSPVFWTTVVKNFEFYKAKLACAAPHNESIAGANPYERSPEFYRSIKLYK